MRVLVVHAHPVETSYNRALFTAVTERLKARGHEVDALDLYAEDFDPRLTREERLSYHDTEAPRAAVSDHVRRLLAAEALVLVFPVWNFGFPAILKGWFDRVFLPGVSFRLVNGKVRPALSNIRRLTAITTYGGTRLRAMIVGDPPRRIIKRVLRITAGLPPTDYLAHYDMNRSTDRSRAAFLAEALKAVDRI